MSARSLTQIPGLIVITVALAVFGFFVGLIAYLYDRTLWDLLELLIVPAVLAVGGYLFTRSENRKAQGIAKQRRPRSKTPLCQMGRSTSHRGESTRICWWKALENG